MNVSRTPLTLTTPAQLDERRVVEVAPGSGIFAHDADRFYRLEDERWCGRPIDGRQDLENEKQFAIDPEPAGVTPQLRERIGHLGGALVEVDRS